MNVYLAIFLVFTVSLGYAQPPTTSLLLEPNDKNSTPAKPECTFTPAMSDEEMRICGIKPDNPPCHFVTPNTTIVQVQAALQLKNYYIGDLSGVFDERTKAAIMVYKEINHLPVNERIDTPLLESLKVNALVFNKRFKICNNHASAESEKKATATAKKRHRRRKH